MNIALAIEYIPRRMKELGHGDNYMFRYRHLVLLPEEDLVIAADNELFLLVDQSSDVCINSDTGMYDLTDQHLNEQCYEHSGTLQIQNYANQNTHLHFIQVIPNK